MKIDVHTNFKLPMSRWFTDSKSGNGGGSAVFLFSQLLKLGAQCIIFLTVYSTLASTISVFAEEPERVVWRNSEEIYASRTTDEFPEIVYADFSDEEWPSFYVVQNAPNLETLVLGGPRFTDDLLLPIVEKLQALQVLVLDSTDISEAGVKSLCKKMPELEVIRSQNWAINQLKKLSKEIRIDAAIDDSHPELRALLGDQHFLYLTHLLIEWDAEQGPKFPISNEQLMPLKYCTSVTRLELGYTRINNAGLQYLINLKSLETLKLPLGEVENQEILKLAKSTGLSRLIVSFPRYANSAENSKERLAFLRHNLQKCSVEAYSFDHE